MSQGVFRGISKASLFTAGLLPSIRFPLQFASASDCRAQGVFQWTCGFLMLSSQDTAHCRFSRAGLGNLEIILVDFGSHFCGTQARQKSVGDWEDFQASIERGWKEAERGCWQERYINQRLFALHFHFNYRSVIEKSAEQVSFEKIGLSVFYDYLKH